MPDLAIIIPFASNDPDRVANLATVQRWYAARFPDVPQHVADDGGCRAGWTKAYAIERAMAQTDADVFLVADSDCLCDATVEAAARVQSGQYAWASPHTQIRRLGPGPTADVRAGAVPTEAMPVEFKPYAGVAGGGIVVVTRDAYRQAPMDPRFKVTHGEDVAWARALRFKVGRPWRAAKCPLYHLFHPPILAVGMRFKHNQRLAQEYRDATSKTIDAVIARGQAHIDPPPIEPMPSAGDVAVIVPVIRRPDSAAPFMASWRIATPPGRSAVYAIADAIDTPTIVAWQRAGATVLLGDRGTTFAAKVNYALEATSEPQLLLVGDDVHFHPGWLEAALLAGKDGAVVSTNDMGRNDLHKLAVHPMFARSYLVERGASFDGPGLVAHEGYRHWYVDREWSFLAAERDELVYASAARIEHLHPIYGKAAVDPIYELGQAAAQADARLYRLRENQFIKRIRRSPDA